MSKRLEDKRGRLYIRCTVNQKKEIIERAKSLDLNISEYIILCGLEKVPKVSPKKLVESLNKVTTNDNRLENNINQLVKLLNANIAVFNENTLQEVRQLLSELKNKRNEIFTAINSIYKEISQSDS